MAVSDAQAKLGVVKGTSSVCPGPELPAVATPEPLHTVVFLLLGILLLGPSFPTIT